MSSTIATRIAILLEDDPACRNVSDMARHCGVSAQAAHQWVKGASEPKGDRREFIAAFFGLSRQELEFGEIYSRRKPAFVSGKTAQSMIEKAMQSAPKSQEYVEGMRDWLTESPFKRAAKYAPGTCQADAYDAGKTHALKLLAQRTK